MQNVPGPHTSVKILSNPSQISEIENSDQTFVIQSKQTPGFDKHKASFQHDKTLTLDLDNDIIDELPDQENRETPMSSYL